MKKIGVVVLHFRNLENTKACLESILKQRTVSDLDVFPIVIDNASDEPFPQDEFKSVVVIRNKINKGFTGGMNTGITYVLTRDFDYILTVNNDTIFDKSFLENAISYLLTHTNGGIFVPKIYFFPGTEFHYDRYKESERGKVLWFAGGRMDWENLLPSHRGVDEVDNGQFDNVKDMDFATGCCMIYKKEMLKKIGMFDDRYFLYYEDIDLSFRMQKNGFELVFMPKAILWHKNAKSAGGAGSKLQDYYTTRNRLLLGMRYASFRTKLALIREGILLVLNGREWQKKGVVDFFLGKFGRGSFDI